MKKNTLSALLLSLSLLSSGAPTLAATPENTIAMSFKDKEITQIIEAYSKASGEKFIIDPDVRGKMTIISPEKVPAAEALHLVASALAVRGFAIAKQDGFFMIRNARSASKDFLETSSQLGELKPQRLFTWVVQLKNIKAESFEKNLRNLISRDGDFFVDTATNKLILTDFISNLHKIKAVIDIVDEKAK